MLADGLGLYLPGDDQADSTAQILRYKRK